jgi:hypothetical protein
MQVLNSDHAFIFVKKNTALALSRLASTASRQLDLGHAGAVSSLHRVLKNDLLFRRRIQTAVYNISAECEKELEASEAAAGRYTNSDRSLVSIYADKFREYKNRFGQFSALLGAENSLMESGSLLYLHTILGGAAWALATGLFKGLPVVFLRRSVYRTALVTGFVPAYFIGGVVTFYQAQLLTMDSYEEAFRLYFGCSVAVVLPWLYMLPILDAYCPLWLGGHIVGFCSFFLSCYLNDSDIFKTDHLLASYEEDQKREQARKEYEDKKKFFQL